MPEGLQRVAQIAKLWYNSEESIITGNGYIVLKHRAPKELIEKLLAKGESMLRDSSKKMQKLQSIKPSDRYKSLRGLFTLDKEDDLAEKEHAIEFGKVVLGQDVFDPALLLTRPGASEQKRHQDTDVPKTYSVIVALTDRPFGFELPLEPIFLEAGDVLVFSGMVCHYGADLDGTMSDDSWALFVRAGSGLTDAHRTLSYPCESTDAEDDAASSGQG